MEGLLPSRIPYPKILHGIVDTTITLAPLSTSTRGHSQRFVTPFAGADTYSNSFIPSTINLVVEFST